MEKGEAGTMTGREKNFGRRVPREILGYKDIEEVGRREVGGGANSGRKAKNLLRTRAKTIGVCKADAYVRSENRGLTEGENAGVACRGKERKKSEGRKGASC